MIQNWRFSWLLGQCGLVYKFCLLCMQITIRSNNNHHLLNTVFQTGSHTKWNWNLYSSYVSILKSVYDLLCDFYSGSFVLDWGWGLFHFKVWRGEHGCTRDNNEGQQKAKTDLRDNKSKWFAKIKSWIKSKSRCVQQN